MPDLANVHLLRSMWLWAMVPALALWILMVVEQRRTLQWRKAIAPHLLKHLVRHPKRRPWLRPTVVVLPSLMIVTVGLAGPTWTRQKTPFVQDQATLMVALDLSESMNAVDVQPTRAERAQQKIRDLLALRAGARTGLLVYAGTAHVVLPPTDDRGVLEAYLVSLDPGVMPVPGKEPVTALKTAEEALSAESAPATILFVTDGIGERHAPAFADHRKASRHQVLVLAVGTSKGGPVRSGRTGYVQDERGGRVIATLDRKGLEALERQAGAFVVGLTSDGRDVQQINRRVDTSLKAVQAVDDRIPWDDAGYYACFLALPLSLVWFRKGWTVRWQ